ncbi:hypothetical protein [Streptomyces sp. OE57]
MGGFGRGAQAGTVLRETVPASTEPRHALETRGATGKVGLEP